MTYSKTSKLIVLIFVIVVGVSLWLMRGHFKSGEPMGAPGGVVKRQDLVQRVTITGQVWPKRRLDVKPPFAGYVMKIFAHVGDRLKSGQPIVSFAQSLGGADANFPVRTPFDGLVTQIQKSEGEYVADTGDQNLVARVEDVSDLYVLATVPELDVAKVQRGQAAKARVSALVGEQFDAVIQEISLSAKDKSGWSSSSTEFQIRALLKSHDPRLFPGMSVLMDVDTNKRANVLTLPHEYIQEEDGNYFVTLESGQRRPVKLGLQTDEAAEIVSGLNEGDRVRPIDFLSLPKVED